MQKAVTPEQLLGRETVHVYGQEAKNLICDNVVLVTGAGGSIGSELVRQAQHLGAKEVYFIDSDEYALYMLQMKLDKVALLDDTHYRLADVRDAQLMQRIMDEVRPDIVFHAAAHKHLPLLERAPEAAVKTNVFGTEAVMKAAASSGVKHVVNISTDKAANPTSALGWSKRLGEHVATKYASSSTRIANVRFGNVLGSRGSFLPTLMSQIENEETIHITHPEVSRFFMTIPEAAGLVIEAACFARRGETYVLDMGTSVRIEELVRRYVELTGCAMPDISYSGLRPGEKLHEELFDKDEIHQQTAHPRIWEVNVGDYSIEDSLITLRQLVEEGAHPSLMRSAMEFYHNRKESRVLLPVTPSTSTTFSGH